MIVMTKLVSQLALQGVELREWVDRQIREESERKEKEREAAKEQLALEREKLLQQQTLVDKELELENLRLRNPAPQPSPLHSSISEDNSQHPSSARALTFKSPRLPFFDDSKDDIDSYLLRFERYATVNSMDRRDWSLHLSALLRGKALEVYTRLDDDSATNYDALKEALLKRYNLNQHGFQGKFRKILSAACTEKRGPKMPVADGMLNGIRVKVLRDSGCSCVVVRRGLLENQGDMKKMTVVLADGRATQADTGQAYLNCPYYEGHVSVIQMESPLYDVILGNIDGAKCPGIKVEETKNLEVMAAETRAASSRKVKALLTPPSSRL
ncbi:reverse transcriptase [Elysia marginata]|uniref:Reverse transcriptase n=1 Tax=Elysia marginata TaxID=1093978 RepID=A0AAV4HC89_9GAST|nr:reverse transcriptase [Elysia marginata]